MAHLTLAPSGLPFAQVLDTGPGFSGEQLDKFNSPLQGTCKEQMGLGLMMVKRLMVGDCM